MTSSNPSLCVSQQAPAAPEPTQDALFGGRLTLWQPRRGYRVNVDSLLLASFAVRDSARRLGQVLDLGAGVGSVGLAVAHLGRVDALWLLEREPTLAALAEKNLAAAKLHGEVVRADLEAGGLPAPLRGSADLVLVNPPFFEPGSARLRVDPLQRVSRVGALEPFLAAAALALRHRGRACVAYPARSLEALLQTCAKLGLVPKHLQMVHARATKPARLCLVELRRAKGGGLVVLPPLCEWDADGARSETLRHLLGASRATNLAPEQQPPTLDSESHS